MNKANLGPLEKKVMECVWENNTQTVREVHTCISKNRNVAYTTIMTLMVRLVDKGYLKRKPKGKHHIYSAKLSKNQSIKKNISQFIANLRDSYGEEAVSAFTDELNENFIQDEKGI
jgi:predicted transcriptional regulator